MKTLKLMLVALFIASAAVCSANADGFQGKPKKSVNITFANAIQNRELVKTMYLQIDPGFLDSYQQLYLVEVTHNNVVYRILGSRQSWINFFRIKWRFPSDSGTEVKNIG
jgi:hypothetical protein